VDHPIRLGAKAGFLAGEARIFPVMFGGTAHTELPLRTSRLMARQFSTRGVGMANCIARPLQPVTLLRKLTHPARFLAGLLTALLLLLPAGPRPVAAGDFLVDRTDDVATASQCTTFIANDCSLRGAIIKSNTTLGVDTIAVPAGTYPLTLRGIDDDCSAGDLDILEGASIIGEGSGTTILNGNGAFTGERVIQIWGSSGKLTISDLTITGGDSPGQGGGLSTVRSVTLDSVVVSQNHSDSAGGGIYTSNGTLTLKDSLVSLNTAGAQGGGMYAFSGAVVVSHSTFSDNTAGATSAGGGLETSSGVTLTVTDSSFNDNTAYAGGGLAFGGASASLSRVIIFGNHATGGDGGGIAYSGVGTLSLTDLTVESNVAANGGGGLAVGGGSPSATVDRSTFSGNNAQGGADGGGAIRFTGSTLDVVNSTLTGNLAAGYGGGVLVGLGGGAATLTNTTLIDNVADADLAGGGTGESVNVRSGTLTLENSIFASAGSDECDVIGGSLVSGGHNLADDASCLLIAAGDLPNTQPKVGPLLCNGGLTLTHALLPGSHAIDAGDNALCPAIDQRGFARPMGAACDIGAVEVPAWVFLPVILRQFP
jgi:predicted outer membrane repeat protein